MIQAYGAIVKQVVEKPVRPDPSSPSSPSSRLILESKELQNGQISYSQGEIAGLVYFYLENRSKDVICHQRISIRGVKHLDLVPPYDFENPRWLQAQILPG